MPFLSILLFKKLAEERSCQTTNVIDTGSSLRVIAGYTTGRWESFIKEKEKQNMKANQIKV